MNRRVAAQLLLLTLAAPLLVGFGLLTPAARDVRAGNEAYERGEYEAALERYRDALTADPSQTVINFNAGDALYKLGRHKEAIEQYEQALGAGEEADAITHYNMGNAYYGMGDYAEAAESYKRTLALNPGDQWAKFNLELALRKLKDQQAQQPKPEESQRGQEREQKAQEQGTEERSSESQGAEQQPAQQGQAEQTEGEKQPRPAQPMSEEEARRLFEAIMAEDEALQRRIRQAQVEPSAAPQGKDW